MSTNFKYKKDALLKRPNIFVCSFYKPSNLQSWWDINNEGKILTRVFYILSTYKMGTLKPS